MSVPRNPANPANPANQVNPANPNGIQNDLLLLMAQNFAQNPFIAQPNAPHAANQNGANGPVPAQPNRIAGIVANLNGAPNPIAAANPGVANPNPNAGPNRIAALLANFNPNAANPNAAAARAPARLNQANFANIAALFAPRPAFVRAPNPNGGPGRLNIGAFANIGAAIGNGPQPLPRHRRRAAALAGQPVPARLNLNAMNNLANLLAGRQAAPRVAPQLQPAPVAPIANDELEQLRRSNAELIQALANSAAAHRQAEARAAAAEERARQAQVSEARLLQAFNQLNTALAGITSAYNQADADRKKLGFKG